MRWQAEKSHYKGIQIMGISLVIFIGGFLSISEGKIVYPWIGIMFIAFGLLMLYFVMNQIYSFGECIEIQASEIRLHFIFRRLTSPISLVSHIELSTYTSGHSISNQLEGFVEDQFKFANVAMKDGSKVSLPDREGLQRFLRLA